VTASFIIRRLDEGDAETGVTLVSEFSGKSVSLEYVRRFLSNGANYLFAALADERPVGFLLAHRLERLKEESYKLFIYEVDVAPDFRRRGVGTMLMHHARAVIDNEKMICGFVFTDQRNAAAIEFYKSTGGVPENGDDLMFVYRPRIAG
jgi:aminoglycoside 3-N-acetyltransferase I